MAGSTSARVYDSLHNRIINNYYIPGQLMAEQEIADEYGISRTPVREALRRLEQDKLVTRGRAGRGYVVRPFDLDEIDALYEVRMALEDLALRTTATRLSPELTNDLWNLWQSLPDEGTADEVLAGDEHFHLALATASGNRPLVEFIETVSQRIHIVRSIDFTVPERQKVSKLEHREILDALGAGDDAKAAYLLRQHILKSKALCEKLAMEGLAHVFRPREVGNSVVRFVSRQSRLDT